MKKKIKDMYNRWADTSYTTNASGMASFNYFSTGHTGPYLLKIIAGKAQKIINVTHIEK